MRWLINYIRQCFCKHYYNWGVTTLYFTDKNPVQKTLGVCKKCGNNTTNFQEIMSANSKNIS